MSLEHLKQIVPVPLAAKETGTSQDWAKVEQELGIALPQDYKDFINVYGTGAFNGYISVYSPFAANQNVNLLKQVKQILAIYNDARSEFPEFEAPYPAFPEPGGLLPWGINGGGADFLWHTDGHPDAWPVVLRGARGGYERLLLKMTELMARFFEGRLDTYILRADVLKSGCYYEVTTR